MANEGLWKQLVRLDREQTARRADCEYLNESDQYTLKMLNIDYNVDMPSQKIYLKKTDTSQTQAKYLEELCILSYLINAQDIPLADKLVRAEALPGGQFFFRGLHKLPTEKLTEVYGDCPENLYEVSRRLDTKKCEYGDASVSIFVLPRIPLTIILWRKCEEFEARASILFDRTASSQLPLDALLVAVNLAVKVLETTKESKP